MKKYRYQVYQFMNHLCMGNLQKCFLDPMSQRNFSLALLHYANTKNSTSFTQSERFILAQHCHTMQKLVYNIVLVCACLVGLLCLANPNAQILAKKCLNRMSRLVGANFDQNLRVETNVNVTFNQRNQYSLTFPAYAMKSSTNEKQYQFD